MAENQKPNIQEVLNAALRILQDIENWESCWPGCKSIKDDKLVTEYMARHSDWERRNQDA